MSECEHTHLNPSAPVPTCAFCGLTLSTIISKLSKMDREGAEGVARRLHAAMEAMGDRTVLVSPTPVTPREAAPFTPFKGWTPHCPRDCTHTDKCEAETDDLRAQLAAVKAALTVDRTALKMAQIGLDETEKELAAANARVAAMESSLRWDANQKLQVERDAATQRAERAEFLLEHERARTAERDNWLGEKASAITAINAVLKTKNEQLDEISKLTGRMQGEAVIESVARLKSALNRRLGQINQETEMALRNLMARIHRDGGQRQDTFPSLIEAAKDCENIVAELIQERDQAAEAHCQSDKKLGDALTERDVAIKERDNVRLRAEEHLCPACIEDKTKAEAERNAALDRIKKALDLLEKHDSCQHTRFVERAIRALRDP